MKAQDLRVNNLVQHKDRLIEICGTTDAGVYVYSDSMHGSTSFYLIEEIEPIELTEEWLLKMGFELTYNSEFTKTYEPLKFSVIDAKWNKTYQYYIRYKGERLENIKYVHQLQNLYFSLCGEELTIK